MLLEKLGVTIIKQISQCNGKLPLTQWKQVNKSVITIYATQILAAQRGQPRFWDWEWWCISWYGKVQGMQWVFCANFGYSRRGWPPCKDCWYGEWLSANPDRELYYYGILEDAEGIPWNENTIENLITNTWLVVCACLYRSLDLHVNSVISNAKQIWVNKYRSPTDRDAHALKIEYTREHTHYKKNIWRNNGSRKWKKNYLIFVSFMLR